MLARSPARSVQSLRQHRDTDPQSNLRSEYRLLTAGLEDLSAPRHFAAREAMPRPVRWSTVVLQLGKSTPRANRDGSFGLSGGAVWCRSCCGLGPVPPDVGQRTVTYDPCILMSVVQAASWSSGVFQAPSPTLKLSTEVSLDLRGRAVWCGSGGG